MMAATGGNCASSGHTDWGTDGTSVYDLAAGNGDIYWEFLEPRWRKGQRIVAEHDDIGQLPGLDAAEYVLLEARVGSVDGLAAQGLRHSERLASRYLLATERLVCHRRAEVAQRIHRIISG
jgi:hypothetical protein